MEKFCRYTTPSSVCCENLLRSDQVVCHMPPNMFNGACAEAMPLHMCSTFHGVAF